MWETKPYVQVLLDHLLMAAARHEARTFFRSLYGPHFYVPQLKLRLKNHLRAVARARLAFRDLGNRSRRRQLAAIVIQRLYLTWHWRPEGKSVAKLVRGFRMWRRRLHKRAWSAQQPHTSVASKRRRPST